MIMFLNLISGILPIVVFCLFWNRNRQKQVWVIFFYTLISASVDNFNYFFNTISKVLYFYSLSFFTIIEYASFSIFLYLNLSSQKVKKLVLLGSIIFLSLAVFNIVFDKNHQFDSLSASTESILIICYSILYFYEQLKNPETTFIYSTKPFWIIIAILLYLAGTFILFISTAYLTEKEQSHFWPINIIANITKNIFLAIGFTLRPHYETNINIIKMNKYRTIN